MSERLCGCVEARPSSSYKIDICRWKAGGGNSMRTANSCHTARGKREIKRRRCPSHSRIPKIRTLFIGHFVSMHLRPHSVRNHLGFAASHGATFRANRTRFGPYQIIFAHSFGYGNVYYVIQVTAMCGRAVKVCTLDAVYRFDYIVDAFGKHGLRATLTNVQSVVL